MKSNDELFVELQTISMMLYFLCAKANMPEGTLRGMANQYLQQQKQEQKGV